MFSDIDKKTIEHIITLLKYAHEKNQVARHRNAVRKRKVRDQQAYINAGLMCKEVTKKWRPAVNIARKALGGKYRLRSDASAGYSFLGTDRIIAYSREVLIYREDFEKVINLYEANKAIEELLKG